MIRLTFFWATVFFVALYTWKDWFRGLCGLILLVGILEMPDVPKTVFGIEGLNFFNVLLLNLVIAWIIARNRERLKFDLPDHVTTLLLIYLAVIFFGFYRMYYDRSYLEESSTSSLIIREYLLNTLKWVVPGILLYDGARTQERVKLGILSVLGIYVFLALMVVKVMPIRAVMMDGIELQRLALKLLVSRIGLHRVTLSMMLAGASWACLASRGLTKDLRLQTLAAVTALVVLYAQSLTAGRAGYIAFAAVGLVLCLMRWRSYLLIAPVAVAILLLAVPSVGSRLLEGVSRNPYNSAIAVNDYDVTAGRVVIWPVVIDKIQHGIWVGFGRMGMWRTGIVAYAATMLDEDFGHPHNAYLEWLLDNGIIGFVPVILFYLVALFHSARLFMDRRSGLFMAAGGACAALVLGLLFASIGSQSFYPIEGTVGMWCALGLMFRMSVQRKLADAALKVAQPETPMMRRAAFGVPQAAAARSIEDFLWPAPASEFPLRRERKWQPAPAPRPSAARSAPARSSVPVARAHPVAAPAPHPAPTHFKFRNGTSPKP
jgi:O-antigen ligase